MRRYVGWLALLAFPGAVGAQNIEDGDSSDPPVPLATPILPAPKPIALPADSKPQGVKWGSLLIQSSRFILFEHSYRYATEPATRDPDRPFFQGYVDSVSALHGWADGDPFYVNYVGHPMQGAVSGYLWTLNDTRYQYVEFGRSPDYWKSRLRAGAFAWVYSEQMEIGPISEASIGNIQASWPQYGLVDHVVTPAIGLGWMIAEDALDQYLVRFVERKSKNRVVRALVRGGANPSRSMANVLGGEWPWARPRDKVDDASLVQPDKRSRTVQEPERRPGVAPFELAANAYAFPASIGICGGGGTSIAFRIHREWQMVLDVSGCKISGLEKNVSGDSLTYMAGSRWTPPLSGRVVPYAQMLFGGNKVTQELMLPAVKASLQRLAQSASSAPPDHDQYTQQFEVDGLAMAAGIGLDLKFNRALAFRIVDLEYMHSWMNELNGFAAQNGLQVKMGLVLHMGNW
ncbi:MAG TPA: hypothetical protein VGQ49_01080 [Bryobacteraceae bacterium]|jgi:hypothetical protein|nr:hypothetical protein [Bryobacteraceae bacterium]